MTKEVVLDPLYPVSELVKRYSRTHEAAHSDLNVFMIDGHNGNVKDLLSAICDDFEIEKRLAKEKSDDMGADAIAEKVIPRFLGHFYGQNLQEVCTLLNEYGGYLNEVGYMGEDWQREMIRQSAVNEIEVAKRALQNTGLESGLVNAWTMIKEGAEDFLPKVTATKSAPATDMIKV